MNTISKLGTVLSLSASVLLGGSLAASAGDWNGFYAGLSYGAFSGEADYDFDGGVQDTFDFGDTENASLFAGYRAASGSFVVGGELAYSLGEVELAEFENFGPTDIFDLKGTVGYDFGKILPYLSLGYSGSLYDQDGADVLSTGGLLIGVGVDVAVTEKLLVGLEYNQRYMSAVDLIDGQEIDFDLETLSLKVGYQF